jgi:hypothetical protein
LIFFLRLLLLVVVVVVVVINFELLLIPENSSDREMLPDHSDLPPLDPPRLMLFPERYSTPSE